jgi:hypothetical protein
MATDLIKVLFEYVQERDRNEFALGDTLDVKTGLILAGLTFLAIQCGDFIKPHLPLGQTIAQAVSVLALVVGGVLAVCELWPRDYDREATPEKYEAWIADTEKYQQEHPETSAITADRLVMIRLESAKKRVQVNLAINNLKSRLMFASFYCLATAFAANIVTLVMRLF